MSAPVQLDIFSDPICPWCYIGLKRLDEALAETDRTVEATWRCYMLNPHMDMAGMDRRAYLENKFGGPEGATRVYGAIEQAATSAGLEIDFAKIERTPNTTRAHQAIREAQSLGQADPLIRALFHAYFKMGQDIGDVAVLRALWCSVGLSAADLDAVFATDKHLDALMSEQNEARLHGVSGVPFFVVDGTYALSGAQDKSVFHQIFNLLGRDQVQP